VRGESYSGAWLRGFQIDHDHLRKYCPYPASIMPIVCGNCGHERLEIHRNRDLPSEQIPDRREAVEGGDIVYVHTVLVCERCEKVYILSSTDPGN
jgi:uncharacterized protein YbaR (Trm112 family)